MIDGSSNSPERPGTPLRREYSQVDLAVTVMQISQERPSGGNPGRRKAGEWGAPGSSHLHAIVEIVGLGRVHRRFEQVFSVHAVLLAGFALAVEVSILDCHGDAAMKRA